VRVQIEAGGVSSTVSKRRRSFAGEKGPRSHEGHVDAYATGMVDGQWEATTYRSGRMAVTIADKLTSK
jgi:hypothetical protein